MKTICGIDCSGCSFRGNCNGCIETDGRPFGGECIAAECYKRGGESCFNVYKAHLIEEFNSLKITDMPTITTLCQLSGAYINSEYTLSNGIKVKLLDDTKIYLGYQVKKANSDRCYGLAADDKYLLINSFFENLKSTVEELIKCFLLEFGENRCLSYGRYSKGKTLFYTTQSLICSNVQEFAIYGKDKMR